VIESVQYNYHYTSSSIHGKGLRYIGHPVCSGRIQASDCKIYITELNFLFTDNTRYLEQRTSKAWGWSTGVCESKPKVSKVKKSIFFTCDIARIWPV